MVLMVCLAEFRDVFMVDNISEHFYGSSGSVTKFKGVFMVLVII